MKWRFPFFNKEKKVSIFREDNVSYPTSSSRVAGKPGGRSRGQGQIVKPAPSLFLGGPGMLWWLYVRVM